jgi:hypothetical protein
MHLVPGFNRWFPEANIYAIYLPGCIPQRGYGSEPALSGRPSCVARNEAALDYLTTRMRPAEVVLSSAKRGSPEGYAAASETIIALLEAAGHEVVLLGDAIRPGRHLGDCTNVPAWLVSGARLATRCVGDPAVARADLAYNDRLAAMVPEFVSPNATQCPGGVCRYFGDDGRPLFRDDGHLNILGSEAFVGALHDRVEAALTPPPWESPTASPG